MKATRVVLGWLAWAGFALGQTNTLLLVTGAPEHGLVVGWVQSPPVGPASFAMTGTLNDRPVPIQAASPMAEGEPWLIFLELPGRGDHHVSVRTAPASPPQSGAVVVSNNWVEVTHDPVRLGGMPSRIFFLRTGKVFEGFAWNDRVHVVASGSYYLRHDASARVECVSDGPVCTVIRVRNRYVKPGGTQPGSSPSAIYDWCYFKSQPLVLVRARITQDSAMAWNEQHILELNIPDTAFMDWAGGEPRKEGAFKADRKSFGFHTWAALLDDRNALAMLRSGHMLFYDGHGEYGTYLHAHADQAWQTWNTLRREQSAWLWIGDTDDPLLDMQRAANALPTRAKVVLTKPALRKKIESTRTKARQRKDPDQRRQALYTLAMAENMEKRGAWTLAESWLEGHIASGWTDCAAGDLVLTFQTGTNGVHIRSMLDLATGTEFLGPDTEPLFSLSLREARTGDLRTVRADGGWQHVQAVREDSALTFTWSNPTDPALPALTVRASASPDADRNRVRWSLNLNVPGTNWGVWRVVFPRVALGPFDDTVDLFVPQASGVVKKNIWKTPAQFQGTYPGGWTAMPFMAAYSRSGRTGMYLGVHDPLAHVKDLRAETSGQPPRLRCTFDHPAPDMGVGGAGFSLSGEAVWQLLRGDWFDASMIYRDWAVREAGWYPRLGRDGREDSPLWVRELCAWGLLSGNPAPAEESGKRFADVLGLPTGFHWYNWHQIPFDNDYPHYFPPRDGFKKAVHALQTSATYVMPYINGRLWDTRDRGARDAEFTRTARPAATKNADGQVYTETYGSKESDGSNVKLAAMCPTTPLWRTRVQDIVLRLMNEYGVKAVYIDQVAAATPRLCFDKSHGHPLGGGGWWVKAYGDMLEELQQRMPPGHMITTECNAEPYLRWFDGYLTWHWQYDGQVPAFSTVYGGAIQLFGRAYRAGPTKDRALRMKAGQQLVYGEQIGWIGVGVVNEKGNMAFLKDMALLRHRLRRYFYAGRMVRPPNLTGDVPRVTADWQWRGVWPVTTDAVLSGAWMIPDEQRLVLIFVNVSDQLVETDFSFNASAYRLAGPRCTVRTITPEGPGDLETRPAQFEQRIRVEPGRPWAWEIRPEE